MDRNWKKWKRTRPLGRRRLDPIREVREEEEYQGGRLKSGMKKTKWGAWEMRWENCRRKKKKILEDEES